jgi:hypothetical protein
MNDRDRDLLYKLDDLFRALTHARVNITKDIIIDDFDKLLNELKSSNERFEMWIGHYGQEVFIIDQLLTDQDNNTEIKSLEINGKSLSNYLIDYYISNNANIYMASPPTVAIKINFDNDSDPYYVEYDGYNLDFDLG